MYKIWLILENVWKGKLQDNQSKGVVNKPSDAEGALFLLWRYERKQPWFVRNCVRTCFGQRVWVILWGIDGMSYFMICTTVKLSLDATMVSILHLYARFLRYVQLM